MSLDTFTSPAPRNRRVSRLSSGNKVRSAFKSPLRSPAASGPPGSSTTCSPLSSLISPIAERRGTFSQKRRRPSLAFNSSLKVKSPKVEVTEQDILELEAKITIQLKEINDLETEEGIKEEDLNIHIDKLHEYNEVKDAAQLVIGRLALQLQTTTRQLYPKFGLNFED
uniref:DNA repair protein SWI5 homolog n=1 Tax=Ciona intestinalis TaxID=7719 RepID=H2XLM7_CIOIN